MFSPAYYIEEIESLRREAEQVGAEATAFDAEAYAESPYREFTRLTTDLPCPDYRRITETIDQVKRTSGTIDYIFPAGSNLVEHVYNVIAELAENRVSEHTYYDNEDCRTFIHYPYEFFGAYVNDVKECVERPDLHYYLPTEIIGSDYWTAKKGLFLYPKNPLGSSLQLLTQYPE